MLKPTSSSFAYFNFLFHYYYYENIFQELRQPKCALKPVSAVWLHFPFPSLWSWHWTRTALYPVLGAPSPAWNTADTPAPGEDHQSATKQGGDEGKPPNSSSVTCLFVWPASPPAWIPFPSEMHGDYARACPLSSCRGPSRPSVSDWCPPACLSSSASPAGQRRQKQASIMIFLHLHHLMLMFVKKMIMESDQLLNICNL